MHKSWFAVVASVLLAGCAARFEAFDYHTVAPKAVDVTLDAKGPGWFGLMVRNIGDQPLTVEREQVTLHTVKGTRPPVMANEQTVVVAPGASKEVKVRYETKDLPMYSMVALHFDHAFRVGPAEAPTPSPMNFRVGQHGPWNRTGPLDCCIKEPVAK